MRLKERSLRRFAFLALLAITGCHVRRADFQTPLSNNSYLDLQASWRLRVVSPVLQNPDQPNSLSLEPDGPFGFTVKAAPNLKGFETQYYAIRGTNSGVQLKFINATLTTNGQISSEMQPLKNYFRLPPGAHRVRLLYLTRSTAAPHDMAMVFARRAADLSSMTDKVIQSPNACDTLPSACLWIPATVAVIPERFAESWQPVR